MSAARLLLMPGTLELAPWIAAELRPADRQEVAALHDDLVEAVAAGLRGAHWSSVAIDAAGGHLVAAWGVKRSTLLGAGGVPWCLCGAAVDEHARAFLRLSRRCNEAMRREFAWLANLVDDRHEVAKRWLLWLGYVLGPAQPIGRGGMPFRRFEMMGTGHG